MALIKGNIGIIGSEDESAPKKCEYCGKIAELRPYGINGANICFECGMKHENKDTTEKMINDLFDKAEKFKIKSARNPRGL